MKYTIELPFPAKELSPNTKCHWGKKAKAIKSTRWAAYLTSRQVIALEQAKWLADYEKLHLFIEYCSKSNRQHDGDNVISSCKAIFDGIADYLGVNDKKFVNHPPVFNREINDKIRITISIYETSPF